MNAPIDRKTFLKTSLGCAAGCLAFAATADALAADTTTPAAPGAPSIPGPDQPTANTILGWYSPMLVREEKNLDRAAMVKLLQERGTLCCRSLSFRRKLIADSAGDTDKLVELMGKIVGPENCRREGDTIHLVYPMGKCGCGRNPVRAPVADDPYCECSAANNRTLFEIVTGRPVQVTVTESPRRGGRCCRFVIRLG